MKDPDKEAKLKSLDAAIERGLADVKAGRTAPIESVTDELLAKLDARIEHGLADSEAGRSKPAEEVFDRLEAKYAAMAKQDRERAKAELSALYSQIAAASRKTPPPADEAETWVCAIDQDTGQPSWAPKALLDAFWALRSTLRELDDDTKTSPK